MEELWRVFLNSYLNPRSWTDGNKDTENIRRELCETLNQHSDNLRFIRKQGLEEFLNENDIKWLHYLAELMQCNNICYQIWDKFPKWHESLEAWLDSARVREIISRNIQGLTFVIEQYKNNLYSLVLVLNTLQQRFDVKKDLIKLFENLSEKEDKQDIDYFIDNLFSYFFVILQDQEIKQLSYDNIMEIMEFDYILQKQWEKEWVNGLITFDFDYLEPHGVMVFKKYIRQICRNSGTKQEISDFLDSVERSYNRNIWIIKDVINE